MATYKKIARGVEGYVEGDSLFLKVDMKAKNGIDSNGGKMKLTVSSSGFTTVDGTDEFRLSIMGGYRKAK